MNINLGKKWFVFVKDKHEGPFSLNEVQEQILTGALPKEIYVWHEGMSDWKLTSALQEFDFIPAKSPAVKEPSISVITNNPETQGGFIESRASANDTDTQDSVQNNQEIENLENEVKQQSKAFPSSEEKQEANSPSSQSGKTILKSFTFGRLFFLGALAVILVGASVAYNLNLTSVEDLGEFKVTPTMKLALRFNFLNRFISPLPSLDVNEEDEEELKAAARARFDLVGPKLGLGLSKKDSLFPELFVASNAPNGAKIKLRISANSSTLLNWLSFDKELELTLQNRIARTGKIQFKDGKPIPRGEYAVTLSPSDNDDSPRKNVFSTMTTITTNLPAEFPKDTKILALKTYFLGGPRDAIYATRLKEFHDRLREKANREIGELKQFVATLENQFDSTSNKFNLLKEGRTKAKQKLLWANFHGEWSKLQNNLNSIFDDWTPAVIREQYFYGSLYQLIHQLSQAIDRVHNFQNTLFTTTQDLKTLQIQIGETTAAAQSALVLVKTKIEQAEKTPSTANGMPQTDNQ
jgi:hypothetical protein